ncbi:MAG: hypothetical protein ACI4FV_06425, partial [Lachnospiraceae bacterium]
KKRAATIVMSLCLLMGLIPMTVFAAGSSEDLPVYTIESEADPDYVKRDVTATFTSDTEFTLGAFDEYNNCVKLDYYNPNVYGSPDEGFDILVECNISLQFTNPTDGSISGEITIPLPSGYDGATAKIKDSTPAISSISYTETTVTFPVTLEVSGGSTFMYVLVEYKEKQQCTHSYDNDADTTCNLCGYVRTVTPPPQQSHSKSSRKSSSKSTVSQPLGEVIGGKAVNNWSDLDAVLSTKAVSDTTPTAKSSETELVQLKLRNNNTTVPANTFAKLSATNCSGLHLFTGNGTAVTFVNDAKLTGQKAIDIGCSTVQLYGKKLITFKENTKLTTNVILHATVPAGTKTVSVYYTGPDEKSTLFTTVTPTAEGRLCFAIQQLGQYGLVYHEA